MDDVALSEIDIDIDQLKEELADKVLSGEKLSKTDRQDIYVFLTGKEPQFRERGRGRPPEKVRDYRLALSYLTMIDENPQKKPHIHRNKLVEQYNISSNVDTFTKAIKKGIKTLQARSENSINNVGQLAISEEEKQKIYSQAMYRLKLIADYQSRNAHKNKIAGIK